ncbi:MAG: hypothetical protein V5804_04305 [Mucilaginibacter sp.]|uniref:hypothetical protein n=1 Tax=Mucilaginibacter sp. TaxID=1882438 RepID=UPI0034E3BE04
MKLNLREIAFGQIDHLIVVRQKNRVAVFVGADLVLLAVHHFFLFLFIGRIEPTGI